MSQEEEAGEGIAEGVVPAECGQEGEALGEEVLACDEVFEGKGGFGGPGGAGEL